MLHPAAVAPVRVTDSHREASPPRLPPYEANKWHLKSSWRVPESLEKVILVRSSLHPHLTGGCRKLGDHTAMGT